MAGDKTVKVNVKLVPYLHMIWNNVRMDSGELLYKNHPEGISEEMVFEENDALAHLLANEQVFINSHWWKSKDSWHNPPVNPWPEEACNTFSINVNCNDVFAWGCADAEEMSYDDLEEVYQHYTKDPSWGVAVWCIKKRGVMPQKPVEKGIRAAGIWDLDTMGLAENPYEVYLKSRQQNNE